jgi:hypothetical protein
VDSETGAVLTLSEWGLVDMGMSLHEWLEQWASGLDLWKRTVTFENKTVNDPLTGGPKVVEVISGVKGMPYDRRTN